MKNWLKENKGKIILSTLLTMVPMLIGLILWNQLPDSMTTHWGADGVANGSTGKAFVVFGIPAIMAAMNLLCMLATNLDPKQAQQNKKALGIIFWIMPMISLGCCGMMYAIALGKAVDAVLLMPLVMGVMFLFIGNYMPKIKQNSTLGIKIYWTLHNEENWNKTHRLAGKVSMVAGFAVLLSVLLPAKFMILAILVATLAMVLVPMAYSYWIYRQHKAQGICYVAPATNKSQKTAAWASVLLGIAVLGVVAVLMFTGDVSYTCGDTALRIEANYVNGLELPYEDIDSIELLDSFDVGARMMGYGSPRLSMGAFQNDRFEGYTLYSYNSCESMILIFSDGKALAFNCQTAEETAALYQSILAKMG